MRKRLLAIIEAVQKAVQFLLVDIWRIPSKGLSPGRSFLITQLRILILAVRGVKEDKIMLRAPALTFYSLFSIVPVVALAFGIAQGFGLERYLVLQLQAALVGREEVFYWLMELTEGLLEEIHGGTLAVFGLITLIYTITMLLNNIEKSFNEIWQVKKGRPLSRKISDYFAMMFILPLFFILASVATVYLNTRAGDINGALLDPLLMLVVRIAPYLIIWALFTLLFMVMPNTRVRFRSALMAGIISGTAFQLAQWGYVTFQIGVARYGAMYGSFAALPLLMLWMHVSWLIVLFGAELSYANHNVESYEFETETRNISPFNKKILSLYVLQMLITNFKKGEGPATPAQVSHALQIPNILVRNILNELVEAALISEVRTGKDKESSYQPALDINIITIKMALESLEQKGSDTLIAKPTPTLESLKFALQDFYNLIEKSDHNKLLKDL